MPRSRKPIEYFSCPHCGEPVRSDASACVHCGSDAQTGWSDFDDEIEAEDEFDYEDFLEREFPEHGNGRRLHSGKSLFFRSIVWLLLISMVLGLLTLLLR